MARKRYKPEEIVAKLRQVDVAETTHDFYLMRLRRLDMLKVRRTFESISTDVPPQRSLRGRGRGTGSRETCPNVWA
jgi:hypothetical protein